MWPFSTGQIIAAIAVVLVLGCGTESTTPAQERAANPIADSLNNRAVEIYQLYAMGEVDEDALRSALDDVMRAIELAPENHQYPVTASQVLLALQDTDSAIAQLERAVELNPTFAEAIQGIGFILEAHGRVDEAIAWYKRAVRAYDERIATNGYEGDPTSRAFAIRMAYGREAGLEALQQIDADAQGRALVECSIKYADRREIVTQLGTYDPDSQPASVELNECLERSMNATT